MAAYVVVDRGRRAHTARGARARARARGAAGTGELGVNESCVENEHIACAYHLHGLKQLPTTPGAIRYRLYHTCTRVAHTPTRGAPQRTYGARRMCFRSERLPAASDTLTFSRPSWRD